MNASRSIPDGAQARAPGCRPGFVWRDARDGDGVCVSPADRDEAKRQNANAANNRQSGGGAYGRTRAGRGLTCGARHFLGTSSA